MHKDQSNICKQTAHSSSELTAGMGWHRGRGEKKIWQSSRRNLAAASFHHQKYSRYGSTHHRPHSLPKRFPGCGDGGGGSR
jgi:hypothetical protein